MSPISLPAESLQGFIQQFGVANSGDPLAILRSLGLSVNEALAGAVGTQSAGLDAKLDRVEQRRNLLARLQAGQPVGGFVVWPPQEANALEAAFADSGELFGPLESFVRYQREVITVMGASTEEGTTIAGQADWLSDYTRSVNEHGQVVWTKVSSAVGGLEETIVFTELEALAGVPSEQVDALKGHLVLQIAAAVVDASFESQRVRFTLKEWLTDVRIDERWHRFGRANEERRSDGRLETLKHELTVLLERLDEIGRETVELAPLVWTGEPTRGEQPPLMPVDEAARAGQHQGHHASPSR